jgi:hypothetical protein
MPQDDPLVISGVGSNGTKIYLTLWKEAEPPHRVILTKQMTPTEAIQLGSRLIKEALKCRPES